MAEFSGLAAGESLTIKFEADVYIVSYSDFMPRAFLTINNKDAAVFANTDTEELTQFVMPIVEERQLKKFKSPQDLSTIATAGVRYKHNQDSSTSLPSKTDALKRIIPKPLTVDFSRGKTMLDNQWLVSYQGSLKSEVNVFLDDLKALYNIELYAQADHIAVKDNAYISLKVDNTIQGGKAESYSLEIDKQRIIVTGSDNAGVFYGLQSLLALFPADTNNRVELPRVEILDTPRFGYRGMHYDNARNFHGKAAMFKLVEQMARYKLNTLHWHFSDDEGWRLAIPSLPELTDIGAFRCFDLTEQTCLLTQLGTGPFKSGSGNGYLTKADFVELLKFAAARHIKIIPEIESPGHARASIIAMQARYKTHMKAGDEAAATAYLLSDPNDISQYVTVQNYTDNSINACMDSSYNFIEKVTYELQQMYREAGVRLENLHFGGDEVGAGSWTGSPICQQMFADPSSGVAGPADLKPYFTQRLAHIFAKRGIAPGAWEDGLMYDKVNTFNRSELPNQIFTANAWDNIWEWGVADRAYRLANNDYQVVLSHGTHLYFDHPYEAHPEERGYYWATRFISNEKVFGYMPDNVYANADFTRTGEAIDNLSDLVGRPLPELKKPENILGMQGQVWSETIRTEEQVLAMLFPRVLAVAERAWHKANWEGEKPNAKNRAKDWTSFSTALGTKELVKLAKAGINPYLDVPGGVIQEGKLLANVATPYLTIEYSLDEGKTWLTYTDPMPVGKQSVWLRSSLNKQLKSRVTTIN
jgi:hexosaminidase